MKKRKLVNILFCLFFLLMGCGQNTGKNEDLCLIDFKLKENNPVNNLNSLKSYNLNSDIDSNEINYNYVKDYNQSAIAVIKNTNRLSFVDMVVSLNNDESRVVYNEGHGDYTCSTTTVFENELWVTKIEIPFKLKFDDDFHSKITIESINFLSLTSEKVEAYMDESNLKTLYFGWIGNGLYNSNGLIYNVVSDVAYVSGYTNDISEQLLIPEKINVLSAKLMEYYVVGIEKYAFKDCNLIKEVDFERSEIITKIGEGAFYNCSNLETIKNYPNIRGVPSYLFYNDTKLHRCVNDIKGSVGKYAFYNNEKFDGDLILSDVDNVDEYAFYNCNGIKNIDICENIITKKDSFASSSLKRLSVPACFFENESYASNNLIDVEIELKGSLKSFGKYSNFITNLYLPLNSDLDELPSSLKYLKLENTELLKKLDFAEVEFVTIDNDVDASLLKDKVFKNLYLKGEICFNGKPSQFVADSIKISSNTSNIPSSAFCRCSFTKVEIESGVTSIGEDAFSYCSSLTSIIIPNSVTLIGNRAFSYCPSLQYNEYNYALYLGNPDNPYLYLAKAINTSITSCEINNNCRFVADHAFSYCSSLTSIIIPNSVTSIGEDAFSYCSSLTSIIIPNSVTSIGYYAFSNCSSLTSMTLPFIGGMKDSNTFLGYIFGASSYSYNSSYVPKTLKEVIISEGCTSIGDYAFDGCTSLTSINIPNSVTSFGEYAFRGCTSLTSINIPNSVKSIGYCAFYYCSSLTIYCEASSKPSGWDYWGTSCPVVWNCIDHFTKGGINYGVTKDDNLVVASLAHKTLINIDIPSEIDGKKVTSIEKHAFDGCTFPTSINIPNSVTSIGDYAFSNCSSLTSINIPNSVISIGRSAFSNCSSLTSMTLPFIGGMKDSNTFLGYIFGASSYSYNSSYVPKTLKEVIISEGCTSIANNAFRDCSSLESITIPSSVASIGEYAFSYCSSLTSIIIPNSVTSIGDYTFSFCSSLTSINIPNSVISIGRDAFSNCSSLEFITIPGSVTSIGGYAFRDCSSLTSIIIPDSVTSIGGYAFYGCTSLTSINIPNSVTSIGGYAFRDCSSLTSIIISDSVTSIGGYAFYGCTSLTSINIPNSVTSIGDYAFSGCASLTTINIPNSVTSIGKGAFAYCSSLTSISIPNSVTSIGKGAFYGCSSLTIYCEASSKPSGWSSEWNSSNCPVVWGYTPE